jgi:hypothetical protein
MERKIRSKIKILFSKLVFDRYLNNKINTIPIKNDKFSISELLIIYKKGNVDIKAQ